MTKQTSSTTPLFLSTCKKCYKEKPPHMTNYTESSGCFLLCEDCWAELTIEQRMPYYMAMCNRWDLIYHDPEKRELVRQAVLKGK